MRHRSNTDGAPKRRRFRAVRGAYKLARFAFKLGLGVEGLRRVLADERRRSVIAGWGRRAQSSFSRMRT